MGGPLWTIGTLQWAVPKQLNQARFRLGWGLEPKEPYVLDGVRFPHGKGKFWGGRAAHCKVYGRSDMSCAKTAEPIKMPFGIWTSVSPRMHILDGVHSDATWRIPLNHPCVAAFGLLSNYFNYLLLWSPYVIGQTIIFSSCGFFFFSSLYLSGRRLDVYHTSTHGVALVWISNAGLKCAARGSLKIQDAKKSPKIAIWAPSHNFVGLYLCN